jgi:hypothetical protein
MTKKQSEMLREIIDLNWEASQEKDVLKKFEMYNELSKKTKALRDDMGHEEYDEFMENGRRMFAPKD